INWRSRSAEGGAAYPGFEVMLRSFAQFVSIWQRTIKAPGSAPLFACNLMYDNQWPADNEVAMSENFAFWKPVGIRARQAGPEVRWSIILEEPELGVTPRVEILAGSGNRVPS